MTLAEIIDRCVVAPNGCVTWQGAHDGKGYPHCYYKGKTHRIFRVLYESFIGPIRHDLLHHTCENRECVNPAHLEDITKSEHHRDKHPRPLATHCPKGHELVGRNLMVINLSSGNIHRKCRICETARKKTPEYKAYKAAYDRSRRNA